MAPNRRSHRLLGLLLGLSACASPPPILDSDALQRGARLFLDPAVSGDGARSCASCHPGGGPGRGVFRDGEEVHAGSPGGRNVSTLRGVSRTPPYLWDGSLASLEAVIERMLRVEMRGGRLPEPDLAALQAYVLSIPRFEPGRVAADGSPVEPATLSARRGFVLFRKIGCDRCHPPPEFQRAIRADMGTQHVMDTPTLRGVRHSAPYGHDGRWATLEEALRAVLAALEIELSERQLFELMAYLNLL